MIVKIDAIERIRSPTFRCPFQLRKGWALTGFAEPSLLLAANLVVLCARVAFVYYTFGDQVRCQSFGVGLALIRLVARIFLKLPHSLPPDRSAARSIVSRTGTELLQRTLRAVF